MGGKPYQSCLAPFENEILELRRRKRPKSCAEIAEHMRNVHNIKVSRGTVLNFLKVRAKGYKPCKYAWSIKPMNAENQPTTELLSLPKQTVSEIRETSKESAAVKPAMPTEQPQETEFKMEWSDVYNLTRLSDEEAAERRRRIEEKRRRLEEEQRRKEEQSTPAEPRKVFKMQFSETYNLHRLPPEEAAERHRRIEEKRKRLMEEQLKKEKQ